MIYKSVFLDIDGTILRQDHTFSPSTKEAIIQLKEQNIEVFFATGRPLHEIAELANQLTIDAFIGYNGAFAIYQGKTIVNAPLDINFVQKLLNISRQHGQEIAFYTRNKSYFTDLNVPTVKDFINFFDIDYYDSIANMFLDEVLGMTIMNLAPEQVKLYEINENIHLSQVNVGGFTNCYDVIRRNVNKGMAIQEISNILQLKKEEMIAFGDGMNDAEMLTAVGEGFAMGNAHPDLFSYAKRQTTSVSEDGIFNGLKQLGLVK